MNPPEMGSIILPWVVVHYKLYNNTAGKGVPYQPAGVLYLRQSDKLVVTGVVVWVWTRNITILNNITMTKGYHLTSHSGSQFY